MGSPQLPTECVPPSSVRSERMLIEQLQYNLLFRWFLGMEMDEAVWNHEGQRYLAEVSRGYNHTSHAPLFLAQNLGRVRFSRSWVRAAWAKCIAPTISD